MLYVPEVVVLLTMEAKALGALHCVNVDSPVGGVSVTVDTWNVVDCAF